MVKSSMKNKKKTFLNLTNSPRAEKWSYAQPG
jgi:hypothetical protein